MRLYTPESVYKMDKAAVVNDGLSEIELMQRAGQTVWANIMSRWAGLTEITVFAGSGNNGGDAFVIAILARQQGVAVQFVVMGDLSRQSATSKHFFDIWLSCGGQIEDWQQQDIRGELVVDGLLGIGLTRTLNQEWRALINTINQNASAKVAIDIPSGLNAQTGVPQPVAIEADLTVTFIGIKLGHYLAEGVDYCGDLVFDNLGISYSTAISQTPALVAIDDSNLRLPEQRKRHSHKNRFGHILVVGGDRGMTGAASLTAQAALRSGAGLVSVLVHPDCVHSLSSVPELMVQSWREIEAKLALASIVVVGSGLGHSADAVDCLRRLSSVDLPLVVDASALTADFLASISSKQVVITPHPGEAAMLLNCGTGDIQADRLSASINLSLKYPFVSVLKGADTIIRQRDDMAFVNLCGNPGMASAGMGDVLAGIIGALMGQQLNAFEAAKTGVHLHARCADLFTETQDQTGLIASDITTLLPGLVKQIRNA